tara:strand:+ start:686 stop:1216 length:531 start_codon:yes stop_codon:yes gene_type:complete
MIAGLDISTSITGITVLDNTGKVVLCDAWDFRKYKGFFLKVEKAKVLLEEVAQNQEIQKVYIEQSLQSFRSGFSSAQTLSTLARFNGTLSWLCYEALSVEPEFIGATTARKLCGIKVPRGKKAKEVVLENILDIDANFVIEYTKHGNPKPGTYDRADSLIIAKAGYEICKQENSSS